MNELKKARRVKKGAETGVVPSDGGVRLTYLLSYVREDTINRDTA